MLQRILDFLCASAAAFVSSSAFKRAKVRGMIFTTVALFFLIGSSIVFFPSELTELVCGRTTSYCNKVPKISNKSDKIKKTKENISYLIFNKRTWRYAPSSLAESIEGANDAETRERASW